VQTEDSIFEREIEDEVLPPVRELGIGFVAYSPLTSLFEWPAARAQSARALTTPFDAEDRPPSTRPPRQPAHAIVATAPGGAAASASMR
jgi:aryl-alcohol dehydrogenase-like predicted oxidoreductase